MIKMYEDVRVLASVLPQAKTAGALNGAAVDTEIYNDGMVVVNVGAVTGTPSAFTVDAKVQESDNGTSGWVDVAGASIVAVTAIDKTAEIPLDPMRAAAKRYVRVVITPAFTGGTAPTALVAANVLLGNPDRGPVANSTTGN